MSRTYSLAYLTQLDRPPPEAIRVAARAGYAYIGLRLLPALPGGFAFPLQDDPAALRETQAALAETGVGLYDIELIRLVPDFRASDFTRLFETGAALGARAVLVVAADPDESRLAASFAALCETAAPFGITCDLEFMPWSPVRGARDALRVVEAAGHPSGRILVDSLHVARSGTTLDDLRALPRHRLGYVQICDAPAAIPPTDEELIFTARHARLLPGDGGIDLAGIFAALPADLPVSVEIPNDEQAPPLGPEGWARRALEHARALLDEIPDVTSR